MRAGSLALLALAAGGTAFRVGGGAGADQKFTLPSVVVTDAPLRGSAAMLGLPEPTADEIAAQVALAAPPAPPVLSDAAKAASDKVIDKAKKEERQSKSERLEGDWLTPVPDAIKAKHTSEDAEKAAAKAQKTPKDKADKKAFALFTGGPATMNADGSVGPKKYQNLPVWVVVYDNVPWTVGGLSASTGGQVLNSTVYYVINDETGEAILALTAANP